MENRRLARELAALEKARADGKPWACGLAVTRDFHDPMRLLCTYTCPQHYVVRGVQRRSPYAGYVIRFQMKFPDDYPFKPMILQAERTFDFFHPLVSCSGSWEKGHHDVPMGSSSAIVHGIYFLEPELWSPAYSLLDVLEEGLQPMWTEGDSWVAASAKTAETCIACSRDFVDDPRTIDDFGLERLLERFPQALPSFGGDMLPFMIVRNEKAEAARLKRRQKIKDDADKQLAKDAVVCPADETSFEITVAMSEEDSDSNVCIQVFPSLPVRQLRTAIIQATGEPADRIQMLLLGGSSGYEVLRSQGTLRDSGVLGPCRVWNKKIKHGRCHPFALNGYNQVAANLLLTDVQKFEHLARQSWSAQRLPHAAQLICRSSFFVSRSSLSPCVPLTRAPPPLASLSLNIPNPHQLHVISGWAIAAVRALACSSPYLLLLRRRVLGWAGVHTLAGHNPLAAPPPGTREHSAWVERSKGYSQHDIPHSA